MKFKASLIAILSLVFLPFMANASFISPIHYGADDWREGTDGDTFTSYYNGTVFFPEENYNVTGVTMRLCTTNPSEIDETISFEHALNGSTSDMFSEWESVGSASITVPTCPTDGTATSTYPDVISVSVDAPFELTAGETYAWYITGGIEFANFYDPQDFIFGVSSGYALTRAVAYCNPATVGFCGTTYFNQGEDYPRDVVPAFSLDASISAPTCEWSLTSIPDIGQCIANGLIDGLSYLFIPTDAQSSFENMESIASTSPISLIYEAKSMFDDIYAPQSSTSTVIKVSFLGEDLVIFDSSQIETYLPIAPTIRLILSYFIWLAAFWTVIKIPFHLIFK